MKLKNILIWATTLAMLALGGCKKGGETEPTPTPTPEPAVEGKITITSDPLETAVSASGGTVTITFTTNKEWMADADASWLHLSADSGRKGNSTITVTVDKNESPDGRSGTVSVTCGTDTQRVAVNQLQKDVMVVSGSEFTVKAEGEEVNITVQANVQVEVASDVEWIGVAQTKGLDNYTFTIYVHENETNEARTGHVDFTSASGNSRITINQEAKAEDPGDDPGDTPTPSDDDDLTCPTPPTVGTVDATALVGYGAGVTGGAGANAKTYHFNSGKALQTWLLQRAKDEKKGDHTPVTIWLSGTFKSDDGRDFSDGHPWFDVKEVSNLSFLGTDNFVMDKIGIFCVRAKNIIIRNINFQQPKANNGADAVSMQDCDGVWVDHCTFTSLNQTKDYEDGSTDITHGSRNVTVSWCRYIKTQKSCLVGHSNSQSGDTQITATFHHNWFEGSSSRHPRVRFGTVHVYNNLFDGNTTYGVGSAYGAKVLVEYNYFDGVQLPTDICTYPAKESNESNLQGSVAGYLYPTENVYVNKPAKAKSPYPLSNVQYTKYNGSTITPLTYTDFKPAYDYTVTAAEDVPALVKAGAGYGKLDGYASAPIAVDNAGITDYDSTDDDPVDPDPGSGDEPGDGSGDEPGDEPGTGDASAHTYVFYYDSSSKAQNLMDGQAGSTYFTATAKADLSSNYSQNFNPWTIGEYTSTKGVKLNSSGAVSFTTSSTYNSTVQFYFIAKSASGSPKIQLVPATGEAQVWDTPYDTLGDSGVVALEKGMGYTIKQKSSEQALLLVIVKETE